MMRIGQKIRNIHSDIIYTIIDIESVDYDGSKIAVYEIADGNFESHRFNANYSKHYKVVTDEEE
tara:strand:- start:1068 stop:1259 length:192 start_codon:yes stop_codon:yes gene_type:complete